MKENQGLNWEKMGGMIPAVIQDVKTREILMLGYMNPEAYEQTVSTGEVTFYSRSRDRLWKKGETSGNVLRVVDLKFDCDGDSLVVLADPAGPTCHRMTRTCFDRSGLEFLAELEATLENRFQTRPAGSYVTRLIDEGVDRMIQKVGEEAIETVIAAKNFDLQEFEGEAADLLFHLMVLLKFRGSSLDQVVQVLSQRQKVELRRDSC